MTKRLLTLLTAFILALPVLPANWKDEGKRRIDHLCELYNNDKNDSLIAQADKDMDFHLKHNLTDYYYETWMHKVNTYVFTGKVNVALKEVKQMHDDATLRNNKYGQALAYYAMGNTYNNMGYLDEAISNYDNSLRLIGEANISPTCVNDIYSYYCDALNDKKEYQRMQVVTKQWKVYLDELKAGGDTKERSMNIWQAYYYLACAQCHLGLDMLDAAARDIEEADKRSATDGNFVYMSVLYLRGQLYLQNKEYKKALECSNEGLALTLEYDDKSSLLIAWEQRAEIMKALGLYQEAAEMYQKAYELSDSVYKKDARTQINELNTLFHVSELEMEKERAKTRIIITTAIVIAVALAILMAYWLWTSRRLRRKNQELSVARDQAQESSRMKSQFIKNISHEIRTPLNIVSGFAQILSTPDMELSAEIRRESSMKIQESTNRITSLINQLLALSESSSRHYIDRTDTIGVNQLCREAVARSGVGEDSTHRFTFTTDFEEQRELTTSTDNAVLALCSLLDNAMKFTPQGGKIDMHCGRSATGQLAISVEDNGCGIPAEKAESIFKEFVQLDEYKEGVGAGLTLARNIARQLGGDIQLDTTYQAAMQPDQPSGNGARFIFTLPL